MHGFFIQRREKLTVSRVYLKTLKPSSEAIAGEAKFENHDNLLVVASIKHEWGNKYHRICNLPVATNLSKF